jgi:hypothetical protein
LSINRLSIKPQFTETSIQLSRNFWIEKVDFCRIAEHLKEPLFRRKTSCCEHLQKKLSIGEVTRATENKFEATVVLENFAICNENSNLISGKKNNDF